MQIEIMLESNFDFLCLKFILLRFMARLHKMVFYFYE